MRHDLFLVLGGVQLGIPLTLFVLWAQAKFFCWQRRRKAQRELEDRRVAAVMARIPKAPGVAQGPAPIAQEPFAVEADSIKQAFELFRYKLIMLRAVDRRIYFPPPSMNGGLDS